MIQHLQQADDVVPGVQEADFLQGDGEVQVRQAAPAGARAALRCRGSGWHGGFGVQCDEVATAVRTGRVAFTAGLRGSGRQDGLERIGRRHVCHETPQQVGVAVTVTGLPTGAASGRG